MRRVSLLNGSLAFALLVTLSGVAVAQTLTDQDRARGTLDEFARCVVRTSPKRVEAALTIPASNPSSARALASLAIEECPRFAELSMDDALFRAALFRALYRQNYGSTATPAAALAPQPLDFTGDVPDLATPENRSIVEFREFADCVVRADPANSRALVLASVGSAAERRTINAIVPLLGPCLTTGLKIRFSDTVIADLVAEALYREARAAIAPATASGSH